MPTLAAPSLAFIAPTEIPPVTPTALPATALPTATPQTVTPEPTPPVTIIIEGPVQIIDGNIVVIFGLTVVLNPTDPVLSVIQVGDVIRVEGNAGDNITMIVAVRAIVVDVEVNVNPSDGQVWRDPGNCSNPPPPWAPAHGWRRRCEGGSSPGNAGGQGMGMGD